MKNLILASICATVLVCVSVGTDAGGCRNMCCPGRNNTCYTYGPRLFGKSIAGRCFCDENCLKMKDCCKDYQESCTATDCRVSQWTAWGRCSRECGRGQITRKRTVIVPASNGGKQCPNMLEKRVCHGRKCISTRHVYGKESRETARILPAKYSQWRSHAKYNAHKGINKNLFKKYHSDMEVHRPGYCAIYEITRTRHGCAKSTAPEWASVLKRGTRICVECQQSAMKKHLGTRCQGHGLYRQQTRWNAVMVSSCHGHWRLVSQHKECTCDTYRNEVTDNESFIFI